MGCKTFLWFLLNEPSGNIHVACHSPAPEVISVLQLHTPYFPSLVPFHLISFPGANLTQTLALTSGSPSFLLFCSPSTLLILLFLWNIFQWIITKLLTCDCSGSAQMAREKEEKEETLNRARRRGGSRIGQCADCPIGWDGGLQVTRTVQVIIQVLCWLVNSHPTYPTLIN